MTSLGGFGTDVYAHDWAQTQAAVLFAKAEIDQTNKRRYATDHGIAFEAQSTADGSWHGYPIPWEAVPVQIKNKWLRDKSISKRDLRKFCRFDKNEIHWAMQEDTR